MTLVGYPWMTTVGRKIAILRRAQTSYRFFKRSLWQHRFFCVARAHNRVAKKPILARIRPKRMARLWHMYAKALSYWLWFQRLTEVEHFSLHLRLSETNDGADILGPKKRAAVLKWSKTRIAAQVGHHSTIKRSFQRHASQRMTSETLGITPTRIQSAGRARGKPATQGGCLASEVLRGRLKRGLSRFSGALVLFRRIREILESHLAQTL